MIRTFFKRMPDVRRSIQEHAPIKKPRMIHPGDFQAARMLIGEIEETIGIVKPEIGRRRSVGDEEGSEARIQENTLDELEQGLGKV